MRRVLAIVPWIVANPGERVVDVARRFGLTEETLLADLGVVYMVGLPPYSPDALVDVQIDEEGRVTIDLADFFSRPLRLTPAQGLALLASSDGLASMPGTDDDGALARALAKLASALGVGDAEGGPKVDVHLGSAEAEVLERLRSAATEAVEVEITYYSYGRDDTTTREIAPWRVFADTGQWYVHAWCHRADGERIFRIDRIQSLTELHRPAAVRPDDGSQENDGVFHPRGDDPRVTLELEAEASWVVDAYPCEDVVELGDGRLRTTLVITAVPWLERLLVRLGHQAKVVDATGLDGATELAAATAERIVGRYG
jgi:proteasome accessory factor C